MSQVLYTYRLFGLNICSDFQLEHIPVLPCQDSVDVTIHCSDRPAESALAVPENDGYYSLAHYEKQEAQIHYVQHGSFIIKEGRQIICYLKEAHDRGTVSQILLCSCMGALLAQRGLPVLHGSLVYFKEKAIIISGDSGAGKSSITARLLQDGAQFMADDTACITFPDAQPWGVPGFPLCKLTPNMMDYFHFDKTHAFPMPDNTRQKYALSMENIFHNQPEPIGAMVIVQKEPTDKVSLSPISGSAKLKMYIHSLYRKELYHATGFDREMLQKSIAFCNQVPMYQLIRPMQAVNPQIPAGLILNLL